MPAERPGYAAVEAACTELESAGHRVTFKEVTAHAGTSRNTLYRRADLRALVEDHRARGTGATWTALGLVEAPPLGALT